MVMVAMPSDMPQHAPVVNQTKAEERIGLIA